MATLADRTVLLTGAAGGIGAAIARRLAARGARLLLVGRSPDRLEALRDVLAGGPHAIVVADLVTREGRDAVRGALLRLPQPLDALVNCAGVSRFALLGDSAPSDIEAQIATNLTAPILLTRLALPFLARNGRILNVGSSFGGIGYPGFSAYCASKFALRGFTEALRRELGDGAVQVACLAPRATRTPLNSAAVCAMNDALGNATDPPERVADGVERMLLAARMRDRALGWPERLFLRINALFPALVDGALRRQLPAIKRFASATPPHGPEGAPMRHFLLSLIAVGVFAAATGAARADEATDIGHLQARWAEVNYQLPEPSREQAFAQLAAEAEALRKAHADRAPYLVWEGIIRSTYAGTKGGLGALGECKKARALFEKSIKLDPAAMDGSAYTSLGSLYYQVPGWPVGFGDDDKARELLARGLEINPDGIDSNYFYGDYLLEEGEYAKALAAFEKALAAPPRPGRESADAGRRSEIERKIAEARRKM